MKSTHLNQIPNMKGKKSYAFKCGCCNAYDFREREKLKTERRELRRQLDENYLYHYDK